MHNAKDNCFPSSPVLENPFHLYSEWTENDLIFYTKKYICLEKLLHNQKWIKEPFEF